MEQSMDEQAVWARVNHRPESQEPPDRRPGSRPPEPPPRPEPIAGQLLEEYRALRRLSQRCRYMLPRMPGPQQRQMRQVCQELQRQVRRLAGVYAFLTGQRPEEKPARPEPPAGGPRESAARLLRQLMQETEQSEGRLEALSLRATGETRRTLDGVTRALESCFRRMLSILSQL